MDPRLLDYYNSELRYLRESGLEFARAYPRIAARLGMDSLEVADPYVERLIESFAFLAARVQLKLDARHPQFTEHLLGVVYPGFLNPVPACGVAEFLPDLKDGSLQAGLTIPRGSLLRTPPGKGERTASVFTTAHAATLWPLTLTEVKYLSGSGSLSGAGISGGRVRAAIRLRLRAAPGAKLDQLPIERLRLFIKATPDLAARLYEQIAANTAGYYVRSPGGGGGVKVRPAEAVNAAGFEENEALLPTPRRGFEGYRLLQEYFAFPDRFLFFDIEQLRGAFADCAGGEADIYLTLDRVQPSLENALDQTQLRLNCTPIINLFRHAPDRVHVDAAATEHHLVPDRNRPMDFEVYDVERVAGVNAAGEALEEIRPIYLSSHQAGVERSQPFYSLQRRARLLSTRQQQLGTRTNYVGTEVFLSLSDARGRPVDAEIAQLDVQALCTNRDLPIRFAFGKGRTDFLLEGTAPLEGIRCIAGPSTPRSSPAFGDSAWNIISHLSLNYLSLIESDPQHGARMLRELLALYADPKDPAAARQIEGVIQVGYAPVVRRIPIPGPMSFARGLEITLTLDDAAFEGAGVLPLASVLERFFARHVSLNSFAQTRVRSQARGELKCWPVRTGARQLL
ncbi:MAG TPA: type VI secretion system baseplate subunit TssF [Steroidobacteraceae bacterium]|nr:type VI secretion system baseplate subunit TssF [Steroidobacteraceae bacterium]